MAVSVTSQSDRAGRTDLSCMSVCAQVSKFQLNPTASRNMRWRLRITDGAATDSSTGSSGNHAAEWEPDSEVQPQTQRWCEERNAGHQGWWAATPRAAASWDATGGNWGAAEWKSQGWWQPEATPRAAASWDATVGAYSWSSSTSTWAGAASAEPTEGVPFASETVMVQEWQEVVVVAKKMVATKVLRTRVTESPVDATETESPQVGLVTRRFSAQGTESPFDATETEPVTEVASSIHNNVPTPPPMHPMRAPMQAPEQPMRAPAAMEPEVECGWVVPSNALMPRDNVVWVPWTNQRKRVLYKSCQDCKKSKAIAIFGELPARPPAKPLACPAQPPACLILPHPAPA